MSSNLSIVTDYNSFVSTRVTSPSASPLPSKESKVDGSSESHAEVSPDSIKVNPVSIYTPDGKISELSFWKDSSGHSTADPLKEDGGVKGTSEEVKEDETQKPEKRDEGDTQGKLGVKELTDREEEKVRELQRTDRKVRMHEMAHMAAGGQYAGGASYTYKSGPDGRQYAVGGEVPIDVSKVKDPAKTAQKMTQVKRAALAPANPSAADRAIATKAAQIMAEASLEMIQQQMEEKQVSAEEVSTNEVDNGIQSYKKHQESIGLNDRYNENQPASRSSNTINLFS